MFGSMCELLKYEHNRQYSIFDILESGVSFAHKMFHFFAQLVLTEDLQPGELDLFQSFIIHSMQFLELNELPRFLKHDFEKDYEELITPIFRLLFYRLQEQQSQQPKGSLK